MPRFCGTFSSGFFYSHCQVTKKTEGCGEGLLRDGLLGSAVASFSTACMKDSVQNRVSSSLGAGHRLQEFILAAPRQLSPSTTSSLGKAKVKINLGMSSDSGVPGDSMNPSMLES